ncbi:uncharacterized protein LOC141701628 [Apium graveolens]|uniref:uncharacterized protein LOC141701628 n=1 Tax=Apium graveolens TaxID=4045 RepID=UPI003D799CB9
MEGVPSVLYWVLNKLEVAKHEEVVDIYVALWGIWFWCNKRVWTDQMVNPAIAMESSVRILRDWKTARQCMQPGISQRVEARSDTRKWKAPDRGSIKLNVDASFLPEADSFSIGMVIRDHDGTFIEGRSMTLPRPTTVFEAECIRVREALSWLLSYQGRRAVVEIDSLLSVKALYGGGKNLLEVGHVIDQCKMLLEDLPTVHVTHIRKHANKVAHSLARIPCLLNCFVAFSSPPTHLVETILNDFSHY